MVRRGIELFGRLGGCYSGDDFKLLVVFSMRSRGGRLALVPKSPVHTGTTHVGGSTFGSRPSR
jgi:hypothetical protein